MSIDSFYNINAAISFLSKLRGFFGQNNVYIGGSLGRELTYPHIPQNENSDIDIFIISNRIETWALYHIMQAVCNNILYNDKIAIYNIEGQWKLISGILKNDATISNSKINYFIKIDFIFVDTTINKLVKNVASDLSAFFYSLSYNRNKLLLYEDNFVRNAKERLEYNICQIHNDDNKAHIEKIRKLCKLHGISIKELKEHEIGRSG